MIRLLSNKIDVYYGGFTDDLLLVINKLNIKRFCVGGIDEEVNTVECKNLNPRPFLSNNDISITASCINIDFSTGEMQKLQFTHRHSSGNFSSRATWTRKFSPQAQLTKLSTEQMLLFELHKCKAFQRNEFDLAFDIDGIDLARGTIAASGKEDFDRLKDGIGSLFHDYQCNKKDTHYILANKHKKVSCVVEGSRQKCAKGAALNGKRRVIERQQSIISKHTG